MIAAQDVSGLILTGGQGSRMQQPGQPSIEKGLMRLHGKPLVEWAADTMPSGLADVYISANRCFDEYAGYGIVVPDDPALGDAQGPLAGLASVMSRVNTHWIYVVPADVPLPPAGVFQSLLQHVNGHQCDLAFACTDRPQPLFMLVNKKLLVGLKEYLHAGSRQVQRWQRLHGHSVYLENEADGFFNINTPADLQRAHQLVAVPLR